MAFPCSKNAPRPTLPGAIAAAEALGYPVVVKLCGDAIAHKTERGLVRLGLRRRGRGRATAATELLAAARPDDGAGRAPRRADGARLRELIAGLVRDPQFGPCVMFGVGGCSPRRSATSRSGWCR